MSGWLLPVNICKLVQQCLISWSCSHESGQGHLNVLVLSSFALKKPRVKRLLLGTSICNDFKHCICWPHHLRVQASPQMWAGPCLHMGLSTCLPAPVHVQVCISTQKMCFWHQFTYLQTYLPQGLHVRSCMRSLFTSCCGSSSPCCWRGILFLTQGKIKE